MLRLFALVLCLSAMHARAGSGDDPVAPRWSTRLAAGCPATTPNLDEIPGAQPVDPCIDVPPVYIHGLSAWSRGWTAYTSYGAESFAEDGRSRWRLDNRANCWRYSGSVHCSPLLTAFVATPDGGAWLLENTDVPEPRYRPDRLRRIQPDGTAGKIIDLQGLTYFLDSRDLLVAEGTDGAAVFWSRWDTGWFRIGQLRIGESMPAVITAIPIATDGTPEIDAVRILPGGDALLVFTPNAFARYCLNCYEPTRLSAARVDRAGNLLWRTDSAVSGAAAATISDEAIWIGDGRTPAMLQRIDADGAAGPLVTHAAFGLDEAGQLASGADGELLFTTRSGVQRLGADGSVLGQTLWGSPGIAYWRVPLAPLAAWPGLSPELPDVLVLDPLTLVPRLRGFFAHRPSDGVIYPYVAAGPEGSIASLRMRNDPVEGLVTDLARFDAPGSTAEARVHRDSFEP